MTTFVATEARLIAALRTGVVPEAIRRRPVAFARRSDDLIALVPPPKDADELFEALAAAGFEIEEADDDVQQAASWAETIPTRRAPAAEPPLGEILFVGRGLDVCATLIELGCDRQELLFVGGRSFVRAVDPPYYPVLRASEPGSPLVALRPADDERRVWIEVGYDHPLASVLGEPDSLLIVPSSGPWWQLPDGPWIDVYDRISLASLDTEKLEPDDDGTRIEVSLRLERTHRFQQETLWILRENGEAIIDRLVRTLPDSVVAQLAFARFGTTWALRARQLGEAPPQLDLEGEAYAKVPDVPDLLVPIGQTIAPPLRPARLRELLAPTPNRLTWVVPGDTFRVESCEDDAFQPLSDWIDYVIDENRGVLEHWASRAVFELEPFKSIGIEWADDRPREEKEDRKRERSRREAEEEDVEVETPRAKKTKTTKRRRAAPLPTAATKTSSSRVRLEELEASFREYEGPPEGRVDLWLAMAPLLSSLGREKESTLCWANAVWEHESAGAVAQRWHETVGAPNAFDPRTTPSAAASTVVRAHLTKDITIDATAAQGWFASRADALDVRTFWLVHRALAALAGGDRLALVRARDAVVHRLRRGLSPRDTPAFVRTGSSSGALLADHLAGVEATYGSTKRKRTELEAPAELTDAYVGLVIGWGQARLGRREHALATIDAAKTIDTSDAIHAYLSGAYVARVRQALDGEPPGAPLPADVAAQLDGLEKFLRFKVDRVRDASWIIEPASLDPFTRYREAESEVVSLDDPAARAAMLLDRARSAKDAGEAARALAEAVELADLIAEPASADLVAEIVGECERAEPADRAALLTDALIFACFAERPPLIEQILGHFETALGALSGTELDDAAELFAGCAPMLMHGDASDQAAAVLHSVSSKIGDDDIVARLSVATAAAAFGAASDLDEAIVQANEALADKSVILAERLKINRALCRGLAHTTAERAAGGVDALMKQLSAVSDRYSTNSHLCLSVVHFMESMVLALTSGNLALTEWARHFVEEDEHRIRWRIHRDLSETK